MKILLVEDDKTIASGQEYSLQQDGEGVARHSGHLFTVIDDEVKVVMGLDMGADDYNTKPFPIRERCPESSPSCGDNRSRPKRERSSTSTMSESIRWKAKCIKTAPKFRSPPWNITYC